MAKAYDKFNKEKDSFNEKWSKYKIVRLVEYFPPELEPISPDEEISDEERMFLETRRTRLPQHYIYYVHRLSLGEIKIETAQRKMSSLAKKVGYDKNERKEIRQMLEEDVAITERFYQSYEALQKYRKYAK